ncbi:Phytanoyl-CoA dioxygenase domain-containing protein 1 homolog [Geodia barretti]|uniref:Phytanoyl-CoA dioxygenase domain-containing protein 1 homolog n=1 Tax=Geodia barretti TaxID=519541 RepID=A0AA35WLF1_GEOBA|nr:Phytanoyl-CoA dioxygenase domain-containing protein 1 homolog [Geodia barretti]
MPTPAQLADIGRELQFYPSLTERPTVLTTEQVTNFNRVGYIKGIPIFDETEIGEHRQYFDALLANVIAAGGSSYSIISAHMKYGKVYDLLTHPKIVACVKDIIGEDVIGWGAHYFCKMPHDPKNVGWHQDAGYWPLTPSKTVTVWLAIDDATVENGAMRFIAGSHHLGHLTPRHSEPDENSVLGQVVENAEQLGESVDVELKAGEISIHTDLLLHGSNANPSPKRRCGLTLRYCTSDVQASFRWDQEGVVVSGKDKSGHWGNPPRPAVD